jgi:hypothetical protein
VYCFTLKTGRIDCLGTLVLINLCCVTTRRQKTSTYGELFDLQLHVGASLQARRCKIQTLLQTPKTKFISSNTTDLTSFIVPTDIRIYEYSVKDGMAYDIRLRKTIQDDQRNKVVHLRKSRTLERTEQKYEKHVHSIDGSTSVIQPPIKIDFI